MSPSADRPAEQPDRQTRVFLSYSRQDLIFATRLVEALKQHTIDAYLDKKDIAPSEDWKERLAALIVSADAVLFLLTPNSAASTVCGWEIQEASRLGKRLIPILRSEPSGTDVPSELSRLNYIYLREADNFASGLKAIVGAITTDIQWVREHTRLEERAQRWRKDGQPQSDILRGEVLVAAETWLGLRPKAGPPITDLQKTFISESRRLYDAEEHEKKDALDRFFISQSRYLCERASEAMDSGDVLAGLLLALEAMPDPASRVSIARERPLVGEAESALRSALHALYDLRFLKGFEARPDLALFNADGTLVLACKEAGNAEVWSVATGQRLHVLVHAGNITNGAFSRKGDRVATVEGRTSQIWDVESGNRLAICTGHTDQITSVVFSPDGTKLLTVSADRTCRMWDATSGTSAALFWLHDATEPECLGPRGAQRIVPTWDAAGRIFRDDLSRPCVRIPSIGDRGRALLSPNAEQILTWSAQTTLKIWNARTGLSERTLDGASAPVAAAMFSRDGLSVHALCRDGSGGVWDAGGANISRFHLQVKDAIKLATFSADGSRVATVVDQSRSVEVWDPRDGRRVKAKEVDDDWIKAIRLSPTGSELVIICEYGRAFVNVAGDDRAGTALNRHDEDVLDANFSRNGDRLVTATARNTAKVWWRIEAGDFAQYGQVLQHGPGRMDDGVRSAAFNADGSKVVTSSVDGTVRTWEAESGRQILCLELGRRRKYPDARSLPAAAAFSPADTWLTLLDEEQRLRIWRTETGHEIDLGQVDPENVASVTIDESDTHLFITHLDGTSCLFRDFFWFGHLVELAKTFAPRGLTADERRRYHLDPRVPGWCVEMRKWPYFYLEDSPLDHVELNSYGQFIMAFRDPEVIGIEKALRTALIYMTPAGSESIKVLADTMHSEYWERLSRNEARLKNTDDIELTAESFRQVLTALKNLGFADAAREMLSEYRGPAPNMAFSL